MIVKAIRLLALEYPPLTALIGFRWQPDGEGQGAALPRITHILVDDVPTPPTQTGPSGLFKARIQINILATDETQAQAVATQLRAALAGRRGFYGGMRIDSVFQVGDKSDYESDPIVYKRIMDFIVTHTEART